jgi:hypothetical protein
VMRNVAVAIALTGPGAVDDFSEVWRHGCEMYGRSLCEFECNIQDKVVACGYMKEVEECC